MRPPPLSLDTLPLDVLRNIVEILGIDAIPRLLCIVPFIEALRGSAVWRKWMQKTNIAKWPDLLNFLLLNKDRRWGKVRKNVVWFCISHAVISCATI